MRAKAKTETWKHYIADNEAEIKAAMLKLYKQQNPFRVDLYLWDDGEFLEFTNVGGNNWIESDQDHVIIYSCNFERANSLDFCPSDYAIDEWITQELWWKIEEIEEWGRMEKDFSA